MDYFTSLIYQYGMIAMFFLILIEYACFPVSSEIVLPFSGAVAASSNISYISLLGASIIAGMLGTSICFFIGKKGGHLIIHKIEHKFPKSKKAFDSCFEKFNSHGTTFVCISRVIPLCRTYVAFVAGALDLTYSSFVIASLIGISVWNTVLIGLGYLLGGNWGLVSYYYGKYKHIIIISAVIILSSFLIYKFRNRNQQTSLDR